MTIHALIFTSPFYPSVFEVDADGSMDDLRMNAPSPLRVRGRIDRLDRHRDSGALRVIDYKFIIGNSMKTQDRNLLLSAVRGYRLQPPMYARLNVPDHGRVHEVQLSFWRRIGQLPSCAQHSRPIFGLLTAAPCSEPPSLNWSTACGTAPSSSCRILIARHVIIAWPAGVSIR